MSDDFDELRERTFHSILDEGYTIHFVPADPTSVLHRGQPYAYTVGRTLAGRPELLVTNLSAGRSQLLLDAAVAEDGRMPIEPGISTVRVENMTAGFMEADTGPLLGAVATFGLGKCTALQVIWSEDVYSEAAKAQLRHPKGRTPLIETDPYRDEED